MRECDTLYVKLSAVLFAAVTRIHVFLLQDRSGRIRQRNRKLAQVRRQAELEAFKLEREREQVNYERQKLMPRSRSDSPRCRSLEELRTQSPDANSDIPLAPIYARYFYSM